LLTCFGSETFPVSCQGSSVPVAKTFWSKLGLLLVAFYVAFREISPFMSSLNLQPLARCFFNARITPNPVIVA
jgi:hypothetical protein